MAKPGRKPTAKSISEYFASGSGRKLWKEGREQKESGTGGIPEYDDGKYKARVVKAWSEQAQSSGRWQNVLEFKFLDGEYKGQKVRQYQGVDNAIGISILLQTFEKLGLEVEGPDEIEGADKKLNKSQPVVEIRLRTKGEYQNVFVNKLIEADEDADEEDEDDDAVDSEADEDDDADEKPAKKKKAKSDDEDEDEESDEDDDDSDDEDDEDEKPAKKKKSKASDDEDEDEDEADEDDGDDEDEDDEEKPAKKSKKSKDDEDEDEADDEDADEDDEDSDEEDDEERVALKPGMKLKVLHEDEEVVGKIVKVLEEKKLVKVKLKSGDIIKVKVPDGIVDVVE